MADLIYLTLSIAKTIQGIQITVSAFFLTTINVSHPRTRDLSKKARSDEKEDLHLGIVVLLSRPVGRWLQVGFKPLMIFKTMVLRHMHQLDIFFSIALRTFLSQ